jgi:hypothetical protein
MRKSRSIFTVIMLAFLSISCNIINPPEDIPSYIKVDTVIVKVTNFDQGSASHNMTCVKLNVGGTSLGFFEMPTMAPSLMTGKQSLFLEPGFEMNGIAGSRDVYPFFEPYTGTDKFDLIPGEVITIQPQTTYKKACKFPWIEDFEDAGLSFEYPEYSDTVFKPQQDIIKEGRSSGAIYLDTRHRFFEAYSSTDFVPPTPGSKVLLEFDYTGDMPVEFGIYVVEDQSAVWKSMLLIRPKDRWNRIYIDIHSTLNDNQNAEFFRPAFRVAWDSTKLTTQTLIMDNIKLIHF